MAATATLVPHMADSTAQVKRVAIPTPPGMCLRNTSKKSYSFSPTPPLARIVPIKINNGTARMIKSFKVSSKTLGAMIKEL